MGGGQYKIHEYSVHCAHSNGRVSLARRE